jgi:hypothetical protein
VENHVAGICVEPTFGFLYAAGLAGSADATAGAIATFDSSGVLGDPPRAAAPVPGIADGSFFVTPRNFTLVSSTPGAVIYYTLDGSTPTAASLVYAAAIPFLLTGQYRLRAIAYAPSFKPSTRIDVRFEIDLPDAQAPVADPPAGTYFETQQVQLDTPDLIGTEIHYTTDGSDPTLLSPLFDPLAPIVVAQSMTIKARAWKNEHDPSPITSHTYYVHRLVIPFLPTALSHLTVEKGNHADRIGGNNWIEAGAVPAEGEVLVFGKLKEALGPFSDVNYLRLGTGADVLDITGGPFTFTFVVKADGTAEGRRFYANGQATNFGLYVEHNAASPARLSIYLSGVMYHYTQGASILDNQPHVITVGRSTTTWFIKVDDRPVESGAIGTPATNDTTNTCYIGRGSSGGASYPGRFYEARFTNAEATGVDLDALHAAVMGV